MIGGTPCYQIDIVLDFIDVDMGEAFWSLYRLRDIQGLKAQVTTQPTPTDPGYLTPYPNLTSSSRIYELGLWAGLLYEVWKHQTVQRPKKRDGHPVTRPILTERTSTLTDNRQNP
jgi:hypothetical protein